MKKRKSPVQQKKAAGQALKKNAFISMFTAIALCLFVVELQMPPLTAIPGIKPGLANIVTLFILNLDGRWKVRDAFLVLLSRILLGTFFSAVPTTLFFSLFGGISAMLIMLLIKITLGKRYILLMSMLGALTHNTAQLVIAAAILGKSVLAFLPMLIASAVITGIFTGLAARFLLNRKEFTKILM